MVSSDARAQSGGDSGSLKRKNASERNDRTHQRRADLHLARAIPTLEPAAALKDGELDLQAFVAAHEFEIRSLEQSMATSKSTSMTRAFQKVPRGLRRRTASHNPKRVPKRLRVRAIKEMGDDNTPKVEARRRKPRTTRARIRSETAKRLRLLAERKKKRKPKQSGDQQSGPIATRKPRPKIRRNALNEPPQPPAKFRKRQLNKTWLPTHAWHAKRARMTEPKNPLWRFAIPLTPNEKIYRATHRTQSNRGAVVWDMSYMSTIALYGNAVGMQRVMRRLGVTQESCWNDKGRRWQMGVRSWTGFVSREVKDGWQRIAPVTIVWNPPSSDLEKLSDKFDRQALFRVHPSAFLELFNELLRLSKMETPQLYIEDLRYEIGSIDFTGPSSTEALQAILTPAKTSSKLKHAELFQSLKNLSNPASLPLNAVLSFSVQDPRLRYPPRKAQINGSNGLEEEEWKLLSLLASWPAEENLQPYSIFDRNARHTASCLPSQKSLDRRRTKAASGSFLKPTSSDPPIPVLLIASRTGSGMQVQGTWTLLAPWKCIMPFWYCLVHCPLTSGGNPRFAGANEIRQVAFERGQPWFPADFFATDAGVDWELEQRRLRYTAWQRRPKSKRVEWGSLDLGAGRKGEIGDGLACDFEYLFRLGPPRQDDETVPDEDTSVQLASEDEDAMDVDKPTSKAKPATPDTSLLRLLRSVSKDEFSRQLSPTNTDESAVPANAILSVRIFILGRGVVGPCARVYRLPSAPTPAPPCTNAEVPATISPPSSAESSGLGLPHDLRSQWLARMPSSSAPKPRERPGNKGRPDLETRKSLLATELCQPFTPPEKAEKANLVDINGHHPLVPNADDLIGFVTTGSFSLSEGRGVAIGSVAVEKVLPDVRADAKEGKLCIVRDAGENVGWLARWEPI